MTKQIANIVLAAALLGCTATERPAQSPTSTTRKSAKATPNLDRTYDWGARPPVANPDRERD